VPVPVDAAEALEAGRAQLEHTVAAALRERTAVLHATRTHVAALQRQLDEALQARLAGPGPVHQTLPTHPPLPLSFSYTHLYTRTHIFTNSHTHTISPSLSLSL
jgi:hypothetical protein